MASKSGSLLILAVLVAAACSGSAARDVPHAEYAMKRPETFQEGTVLIPGIGRYELGSHYMPYIGGLDHSIPAAANGQFIPGADDTWVPNPGFEVPNPFRPASTESP
ncbi:putative cell wall protein isoform X2 [Triticum dicoccoides]|uniref:putative cell wall protein isoform X1 n=1 Tax=Triticum dicoccoides TaxID=85692 RepID=UPI001891D234|nr:putative cell wall protein isoform X1 [Triticum dicoccoides]XP_037455064.1 putative cell wall protein isoform X2 [Triticum dicoccoides]